MYKFIGLSKIPFDGTDQGISAALLWEEIRVHRENQPVRPVYSDTEARD